ncbi:MAG: ATP-binding cassette domain-containing protein [Planctomycetes bacterium]|nr:ATP-binding cassette domain-containing protein [Planctomycetota bacterium]
MSPPELSLRDVSVSIKGKSILQGINLNLEKGEHMALTGPSGSGKSSLLKVVMGVLPVSSGHVEIEGQALSSKTVFALRQKIAYIDQSSAMGAESVEDALMLPYTFKAMQDKEPNREELLHYLDLLAFDKKILHEKCSVLSGGQQQRLSLIRALLLKRPLILADEVTASLDAENKERVMDLLQNCQASILSISHDKEWIERCPKTLVLNSGEIVSGEGDG